MKRRGCPVRPFGRERRGIRIVKDPKARRLVPAQVGHDVRARPRIDAHGCDLDRATASWSRARRGNSTGQEGHHVAQTYKRCALRPDGSSVAGLPRRSRSSRGDMIGRGSKRTNWYRPAPRWGNSPAMALGVTRPSADAISMRRVGRHGSGGAKGENTMESSRFAAPSRERPVEAQRRPPATVRI